MPPRRRGGRQQRVERVPALECEQCLSVDQGFDLNFWNRNLRRSLESEEERARCDVLRTRLDSFGFVPGKFVDTRVLREFDLSDRAMTLLDGIGWRNLLTVPQKSYTKLALEFYSTLEVREARVERKMVMTGCRFRLGGHWLEYNMVQMAQMFGFDPSDPYDLASLKRKLGPDTEDPVQVSTMEFLGEEAWGKRNPKATSLHDDAMFYIHRVITHTVLARGDSNGNVTLQDRILLYCMSRGHHFNGIFMLLKMFKDQSTRRQGKVVGGGMITIIAKAHGFTERDEIPYYSPYVHVDRGIFLKMKKPGEDEESEEDEAEQEAGAQVQPPARVGRPREERRESEEEQLRDIPDGFTMDQIQQVTEIREKIVILKENFRKYKVNYELELASLRSMEDHVFEEYDRREAYRRGGFGGEASSSRGPGTP